MRIVILNETDIATPNATGDRERRVALIPDICGKLVKGGHELLVEAGAGAAAGFADALYLEAGAQILEDRATLLAKAQVHPRITKPGADIISGLPPGCALIAFLQPLVDHATVKALAEQKLIAVAMELIPRITRAQFMDALSSMATVAGYKAVLLAANSLPRFFPMLTTAAGTIRPAKVIVIGAGVAGLQAIATARRLGAEVIAYDVRAAAGEQIRSLGAHFEPMEVDHAEDAGGYAKELSADFYKGEQEMIRKHSKDADAIISTALIPGRPAPLLITKAMVEEMKPGSAIVDLSAAAGGNCELTQAGRELEHGTVRIIGYTNLPAMMPEHASQLYSRNIQSLLGLLCPDSATISTEDEVVKSAMVTKDGEIVSPAVRKAMGLT